MATYIKKGEGLCPERSQLMPRYIVKLKTGASLERLSLHFKKRRKKFAALKSINAVVFKATDLAEASQLIQFEEPIRLDEDRPLFLPDQPFFPVHLKKVPLPWGMKRIGATLSRISKKYPRPKVALLGPGINPHPHLPPVLARINLSDEPELGDHHGLGTHMAGIIGGYSTRKGKHHFHGVYPRLPLYDVKLFNKRGESALSRLIRGLEWCMEKKINIAVFSFALPQHHPAFYEAVKAASRQGIIMVAPCGDDGALGVYYPARYREVVAVGSVTREDQISSFSQAGTDLDLVAPGEEILSTGKRGQFETGSGSALACAHVAGCLALCLSLRPQLTLEEIRSMFQKSCQPLSASPLLQGYGLISLKGLLAHLLGSQGSGDDVE